MKSRKKQIINALLLLLAAGVFVLIGVKTDWATTWKSVKSADPFWLLLATAIMPFAHWLRGYRWDMLTRPAGYPLNARRSFYAVMTGYLVNVATSRGGEVARCALAAKSEKAPLELLIGTVVTERIIDMIMLLMFAMVGFVVEFEQISGFFQTYVFNPLMAAATTGNLLKAAAALVLTAALLLWWRRRSNAGPAADARGLKGILGRFSEGLRSVFNLEKPWLFILLSITIWSCYWLGGYCLLKSLHLTAHMTPGNAISLLVFSAIGIAIPLPAGAGVWGAISFGLTTVYGLDATAAETFGIYNVAFSNLYCIIFGAIAYLLYWLELQKMPDNG